MSTDMNEDRRQGRVVAPLLPAAGDTTVDVNTESFNGTQSRTTMTSKVQTDTSLIAKIPDRVRSVLRNSWNGGGGETEACYSTSATEKTTGVTTFANTATKTPVASGLSQSCSATKNDAHKAEQTQSRCSAAESPSSPCHPTSNGQDEVSSYQWHSWFTKEEKGRCFRWWKAEENDQVSSFITDGLHLSSCSSSSSFHKAARTDASSSRTSKMENARQGRSEVDDFYRSSGGASSRCSYRGVSDCSNTANSSSRYPSRLGSGSAALSAQAAVVDIGKSTHFLCGPKQHREIISIQNARQPGGAPRRDDHWRELSLHILRLKRAAEARCRGYLHPVFPKWHTAQQRKRELSSLRPTIPDEERLANDTKAAAKKPDAEVLVPCVFTWPHGGHAVYLVGSFNNWSSQEKIRMVRSGHEFTTIKELPRGVHHYKFIVDDQWHYTPTCPTHTDEHGNINNVLDISHYNFYCFTVLSEHEKARSDSYDQYIPGSNDYTTDAPALPVLLSKSNCVVSDLAFRTSVPLHALANHVYLDSQSAQLFGPSIACITSTQRWRRSHQYPLSTAGQRYSTVTYVTLNPLYLSRRNSLVPLDLANPLRCLHPRVYSDSKK